MSSTGSRKWVFRLSNPESALATETWSACYGVYQFEIGEETYTPHFQGCVAFKSQKYLHELKRYGAQIHWEVMRGTWDEAWAYSSKEETRMCDDPDLAGPWVFGDERLAPKGANGTSHIRRRKFLI